MADLTFGDLNGKSENEKFLLFFLRYRWCLRLWWVSEEYEARLSLGRLRQSCIAATVKALTIKYPHLKLCY